ncbi:hypothetical protein HMI55_007090 [Coelomomyces lativittatus]|nr:hypothetical protein HMI55_007090 [Coelomomyces lativittatus]
MWSFPYWRSVFCLVCMLVCNGVMSLTFAKAFQYSQTTLQVTTVNLFFNLLMTALFGYFLFHEPISSRFIVGLLFIFIGHTLLSRSQVEVQIKKQKDT